MISSTLFEFMHDLFNFQVLAVILNGMEYLISALLEKTKSLDETVLKVSVVSMLIHSVSVRELGNIYQIMFISHYGGSIDQSSDQ